jgi:hypothetical protein
VPDLTCRGSPLWAEPPHYYNFLVTKTTSAEDQVFLDDLDKKLWNAADRLRSNLDAAVYKHAVLGLS